MTSPDFPGFTLVLVCLVTFLVMFLPRPRQLTALGKEGMYVEDQQVSESPSPYLGQGKRRQRGRSLSQEGEEVYQQPGSYMGFHRPLGVVPPSSDTPHTPVYTLPPPHSSPLHFPSHFYPDKLYQYWHHYYPRLPPYQTLQQPPPRSFLRLDPPHTSLQMLDPQLYYARERSLSRSPNNWFRAGHHRRSPSPIKSYYAYY